jgi:LPXTG-motif cell wall-anchored protein
MAFFMPQKSKFKGVMLYMKHHISKRATALVLSFFLAFTAIAVPLFTASAASEHIEITMIDYPRGGGTTSWGHGAMNFMNGWKLPTTRLFSAKAAENKSMQVAYCVQPNVPLETGDYLPEILPENFLDTYDNGSLDYMDIQKLIGRIFQYGYTGNVTVSLTDDQISNMIATQTLVWEVIVGERAYDFGHITPPAGLNAVAETITTSHPLHDLIFSHYNRIVSAVQNHSKIPSFMNSSLARANTFELTWNGSKYTLTLTDGNGVLSDFAFSSTTPGVSFDKQGNTLIVSTNTAPSGTIDISASRSGAKRSAVAFWCSNAIIVKGTVQGLVMSGQDIADPIPAYVKAKVSYGSMAILKTTQHNNGSVSGFTFEVRNSAGTLIGIYISNDSGKIDIPNLMPGAYSVKEVNLSSDFVEPTPNPKSVTVNAGQTASVSFDNIRKRGVITVKKTDANFTMGGYSLAGAQFEVRDQGGTLVDTITTDSTGRAQTKILALGVYRVKETVAPYGFELDPNTYNVPISGTQGNGEVVYAPDTSIAEQPEVGRINIAKSNKTPNMGDYNLAGAKYEIRAAEDIKRIDGSFYARKGDLVDTIITDSQGKAQSKDLHLGSYEVKEVNAPYGYTLDPQTHPVTLSYGGQTAPIVYEAVSSPEEPEHGIIRVHKQNKTPSMGDYPLNNAVFEVRAAADIKQLNGTVIYNKGDLADTITTNTAGEAQTKELPLGAYTVREKTAPYGFVLNTETYNPVLSYQGQTVAVTYTDVTVPEAPQVGTITIAKRDKVTGDRAQGDSTLKGAVYEVYAAKDIKKLDGSKIYAKDQLADTLYCGNNTFATSKELPLGDYYYKEKVPPVGYTLDPNSYPVTIEYQGQDVKVVKKYGDLKNKVIEGQIAIVKHTDEPDPDVQPGDIQIEQPLEGAVFEVYLKKSGSYNAALDTEKDLLTTDSDGYAITKKLPYGIYTVKEISAAGLDVKLVKPFDVFISADGKVYRYILNDPWFRSLVKILKVDSETGKTIPAAGISFKVKDLSTGAWVVQHFNYPVPTDIDVYETAPDGTLVMPESLKSGNYELYEQKSTYGYILSKDPVPFTIHSTQENSEIIEVYMANAPAKGIITIEKKGNMLTGVSVTDTAFGKQFTPIYGLVGLKGAVFSVIAAEDIYTGDGTLRAAKDTVVDTITTNAAGLAETKQLYLGNYTVVETKAPVGFVLDPTPHPATLTYENQYTPVVTTQIGVGDTRQQVEIDLKKLMEKPVNAPDGFNAFQDVIFGLFADENITDVNGKVVISKGGLISLIQVDDNGYGVVKGELPFARYYVQELQTNIFYQLDSTKYPINAEYVGQEKEVSTVHVNNGGLALPNETKLGRIVIEKTGEMLVGANRVVSKGDVRYTPLWEIRGLPNVIFDVVAAEAIYNVYGKLIYKAGDVADTITTGADGIATSKEIHIGNYQLVEKSVPFGYISDGKPVDVTLGFDGQLVGEVLEKSVSIFNERQKAVVSLNKIMEQPENPPEGFNPYEDVRFALYTKDAVTDVDGNEVIPAEALIEEFGVDENGKATIKTDLPFGSYYAMEIMTATGYALDETAYNVVFEYDPNGGKVVEIAVNGGEVIENKLLRGSLKVIKTFEGKDYPIEGIPFTITGETTIGTPVEFNVKTDVNGEILLENLLVGNYTVKELESDLTVGYVLSPEENAVVAAYEIAELTINNKLQRGDLRIIKTFEGVSTPIKGVKFTIKGTGIAGFEYEETFETDENGVISIEGLPIGEYKVLEIASDLTIGYFLSDEQTAVVATDELTEMTINNKLIRGNIKVLKTDSETGKPLAGAKFGLFKDGVLIAEAVSGEDGVAAFDNIPYGDYEIKETAAPSGYKKSEAVIKVGIKENEETLTFEMTNEKFPPSTPPKTGDDSNSALYLILMGLSVAALVGLGFVGKRRKFSEN